MLSRLREAKGFTLIELMVVVAIIGIILAIAVPYYINYKRTACDTTSKSDIGNLKAALENLATEMTENTCTTGTTANPRLKTPADISWTTSLVTSLVNYYGWGGTSVKCDTRVRYISNGVDSTGATVAVFQAAAFLGRRPDGEASNNRWVYQIPAAGGTDLPVTKGDPGAFWGTFTTKRDMSMGCGP